MNDPGSTGLVLPESFIHPHWYIALDLDVPLRYFFELPMQ